MALQATLLKMENDDRVADALLFWRTMAVIGWAVVIGIAVFCW